jgi:hypothetical protein
VLSLEYQSKTQLIHGMVETMRIYSSKGDKYCAVCSVCGGDHNVVIIPLKDGRRRIISLPFPNTETKLAELQLKLRRGRKSLP